MGMSVSNKAELQFISEVVVMRCTELGTSVTIFSDDEDEVGMIETKGFAGRQHIHCNASSGNLGTKGERFWLYWE